MNKNNRTFKNLTPKLDKHNIVLISFCFLCVILFSVLFVHIGEVYCLNNEYIEFLYNGRVFNYELKENIKTSNQFDLNYEINKFNRFDSAENRKKLFSHMLDIGFDKGIALNYIFPNLDDVVNKI